MRSAILGCFSLEPLARVEHHLLDAVDREVVVRQKLAAAPLVKAGDVGQLAQREDQVPGVDRKGQDRSEERLLLGRGRAGLIGFANPGPVEDRADEENRFVARFELVAAATPSS